MRTLPGVWQVNTCDHMALIADVVCHTRFLSRALPLNMTFLAACNPYRRRRAAAAAASGSASSALEAQTTGADTVRTRLARPTPPPPPSAGSI